MKVLLAEDEKRMNRALCEILRQEGYDVTAVEDGPGGGGEGSWTVSGTMVKTQSSSKGLSSGSHTVTVGSAAITYTNAYSYSGYTTVFASATATVN